MKKKWTYSLMSMVIFTIASLFILSACSDDDPKNARVEIRLTDAPGDYDEVNVDIQSVKIHVSDDDDDGEESDDGWRTLDIDPGIYNLLDFTNGLDTLLGVIEVPAGRVSQIRLVLGNENTIRVNGDVFPLSTPSAEQSGLKLNVHENLREGITYIFLLDFDAAKSIVLTGNGTYKLKPVIRVITDATSGAIEGSVSIPASTPAVFAIADGDTLGTTFADSTGRFMIQGLPADIYTVSFSPATGYTITDKTGVVVTVGSVTDLGVILVEE